MNSCHSKSAEHSVEFSGHWFGVRMNWFGVNAYFVSTINLPPNHLCWKSTKVLKEKLYFEKNQRQQHKEVFQSSKRFNSDIFYNKSLLNVKQDKCQSQCHVIIKMKYLLKNYTLKSKPTLSNVRKWFNKRGRWK